MNNGGLDLASWLTILGVFVVLFGLPGALLELDRRKKLRARQTTRDDD